jgi:hypothetical protein
MCKIDRYGVHSAGHLKGKGRGSVIVKPPPSYQPDLVCIFSSCDSQQCVYVPCFCMTDRNLMITLELGRIMTWRLPAFSALLMDLSASLSTDVLTILAVVVG